MALLKDTMIKEGVNLEFRAELFNAFNHASLVCRRNISDPQTISLIPSVCRVGRSTLRTTAHHAAFTETLF